MVRLRIIISKYFTLKYSGNHGGYARRNVHSREGELSYTRISHKWLSTLSTSHELFAPLKIYERHLNAIDSMWTQLYISHGFYGLFSNSLICFRSSFSVLNNVRVFVNQGRGHFLPSLALTKPLTGRISYRIVFVEYIQQNSCHL